MEECESKLSMFIQESERDPTHSIRHLTKAIKYVNDLVNKNLLNIDSKESRSIFMAVADVYKRRAHCYKRKAEINKDLCIPLKAYEDLLEASHICGFHDESLASDRKDVLPLVYKQLEKSQKIPADFERTRQIVQRLEEHGRHALENGDLIGTMSSYWDATELGTYLLLFEEQSSIMQQQIASCFTSYAEAVYNLTLKMGNQIGQEQYHKYFEDILQVCTKGIEIIHQKCVFDGSNVTLGQLYFWKAKVYNHQRKCSQAEDAMNQALKLDPENTKFQDIHLGIILRLDPGDTYCFFPETDVQVFFRAPWRNPTLENKNTAEKEKEAILSTEREGHSPGNPELSVDCASAVTVGSPRSNLTRAESMISLHSDLSTLTIPENNLKCAISVSSLNSVASTPQVQSEQKNIFKEFEIFATCDQCYKLDPKRLVETQCKEHFWHPIFVCKGKPECFFIKIRDPLIKEHFFEPRLCKYIERRAGCVKKICYYAHSKEEEVVWKWMKKNKVSKVIDVLEASKRHFQKVKPVKPEKPNSQQIIVKPPAAAKYQTHGYVCLVCDGYKRYRSRFEFEQHLASKAHLWLLRASRGWTHRFPPNKNTFELCEKHLNSKSCSFSKHLPQDNNCPDAHSVEEFEEWKERSRDYSLQKKERTELNRLHDDILHSQAGSTMVTDDCISGVHLKPDPGEDRQTYHQVLYLKDGETYSYEWKFQVTMDRNQSEKLQKVCLLQDRFRSHFCMYLPDNRKKHQIYLVPDDSDGELEFIVDFNTNGRHGNFSQWLILDFGKGPMMRVILTVDVMPENAKEVQGSLIVESPGLGWKQPACHHCSEDGEKESSVFEELTTTSTDAQVEWPRCLGGGEINFFSCKSMMHSYLTDQKKEAQQIVEKEAIVLSAKLLQHPPVGLHNKELERDGYIYGEIKEDLCSIEPQCCQLLLTTVSKIYLQPIGGASDDMCEGTVLNHADYLATGTPRKCLYFRMSQECATGLKINGKEFVTFRMQFVLDTVLFNVMHESLEKIQNCLLCPQWDEAMKPVALGKLSCRQNELPNEKIRVIEHVLCQAEGHMPPLVVLGPGGSGKSFTLKQALFLLAKDKERKVLICCKKSSDADAYVLDLHRRIDKGDLPITGKPLRILGASSPSCLDPIVREYCTMEPCPTQAEIDDHRVIISTFSACVLLRKSINKVPTFTHVMVDGLDQGQNFEHISPFMYVTCGKTITVLTADAVMNENQNQTFRPNFEPSHLLLNAALTSQGNKNNFFFHMRKVASKSSDIVQFLSDTFYESELHIEIENLHPQGQLTALNFFYRRGLETQQGLSYFNDAEAQEIVEVILEIAPFSEDIAVISPFMAQMNHLEKCCKGLQKAVKDKLVFLTPETVQGKQFDSVLLSTVRTPKHVAGTVDFGSLDDANILRMVFSCVRMHIVVFGDPFLMSISSQNKGIWRRYLRACEEKGTVSPQSLSMEKIESFLLKQTTTQQHRPPKVHGKRKKLIIFQDDRDSPQKGLSIDSKDDFGEIGLQPDPLADKVVQNIKTSLSIRKNKLKMPQISFKRDDESRIPSESDNILDRKHDWKKGRNLYAGYGLVNEITDEEDFLDEAFENYLEDYSGDRDPIYENLPKEELEKKLLEDPGKYKLCILHLEQTQRGYAVPTDQHETILRIELFGRDKCGLAFNESHVVVELLNPPEDVDVYRGKVIGVLRQSQLRKYAKFACIADHFRTDLMRPLCQTFPKMNIYNKDVGGPDEVAIYSLDSTGKPTLKETVVLDVHSREHVVFVVRYLQWKPSLYYPFGIAVDKIEVSEDWESRLDILKIQYNLSDKFTSDVTDFLKTIPDMEYLVDFDNAKEEIATFTIDPLGAKDLDDALSLEYLGKDEIRIGVHIADVSLIVKKDQEQRNPIDDEAEKRGETFYPSSGDPSVPMLPEKLSSNICSLIPGRVRPVISVYFSASKNGELKERPAEIKRNYILSKKQLTYDEADALIDSPLDANEENLEIANSLKLLYVVAKELSRKRKADVELLPSSKAHCLVEEFMVLTNTTIANKLLKKYPRHIPLRVQSSPDFSQLQMWKKSFAGISMHSSQAKYHLKRADPNFADVASPKLEYMPIRQTVWEEALNCLTKGGQSHSLDSLRCLLSCEKLHPLQRYEWASWVDIQRSSKMVCSGTIPAEDMSHFDLGIPEYTRFTSPIRRYIDIVVHRLVVAMLENQEVPPYTVEEVQEICESANSSALKAKHFSRSCQILKFSLMLKECGFMGILPVVTKIDGQRIQLNAPYLNFIPYRALQITYSLLGVCEKPSVPHQVVDDIFKDVSLIWSKKIFSKDPSVSELTKIPYEKDKVLEFYPHRFTYDVPIGLWDNILRATKEGDVELAALVKGNDKAVRAHKECHRGKMSCFASNANGDMFRGKENQVISREIRFKLNLNPGNVVQVLLGAKLKGGILQPNLVAFSPSKHIHCCLQHREDPIDAFCKLSDAQRLKDTYTNVKMYTEALLSLLQLEAAVSAVTNDESVSIQKVKVKWMKKGEDYFGKFELENKFCEDRHIRFNQQEDPCEDFSESKLQNYKQYHDYLCIIYPELPTDYYSERDDAKFVPAYVKSESAMWVAHGMILHVENKSELHTEQSSSSTHAVYFKLNENDVPPMIYDRSQDQSTAFPCTVDIISKALPDRRMEWAVRELSNTPPDQLPQKIALGDSDLTGNLKDRDKDRVDKFFQKHEIDPEAEKEREEWKKSEEERIKWIERKRGDNYIPRRRFNIMKNRDQRTAPYLENYIPRSNEKQKEACVNALLKPFALIQGPPGTGKSLTGIRLVYLFVQWNKEKYGKMSPKQVLYCGPSNKSVDVVTDFLKRKFSPQLVNPADKRPSICPTILRVYGDSIVLHDFPVPKRSLSRTESKEIISTVAHKDVALHHIIRKEGKPYAAELLKFDAKFKKYFEDPVKFDVSDSYLGKYSKLVSEAEKVEIKAHEVILCTCTTSGTPKITGVSSFEQCIVDESGMCVEAESLIPIVSSKAKQVILIGDHKQLRPIIKNNTAREFGLERSLFERYASFDDGAPAKVMLNSQYRMHPDICHFPSWQFYEGELRNGSTIAFTEESALKDYTNLAKGLWYQTKGFKFLHIEGEQEIVHMPGGKETSKRNMDEVKEVARIYSFLTSREGFRMPSKNIVILSQYPAQVEAIRAEIYVPPGVHAPVHLLADIQKKQWWNRKWDIVIFSAVCSLPEDEIKTASSDKHIEQLGHPEIVRDQIWDVAYRRARKNLVLIGNKTLLKCDKTWDRILQIYEYERCVIDASEFLQPDSNGRIQKRFWFETRRHKFLHMEGEEESLVIPTSEGGEMSKKNMKEVDEVVRIFDILTSKTGFNVSPKSIMILSQYRAQVSAIMSKLEGKDANVSTVVASQGGEWDIVIFTTVRSIPEYEILNFPDIGWCKRNLGFIRDAHQINVALTRARKSLIITGNKKLLKCDKVWRSLLKEYEKSGCLMNAEEFLPKGIKSTYFFQELPPRFQKKLLEGNYYTDITEEEYDEDFDGPIFDDY